MPPGTDVKEYYGNVDFGLPDTYLSSNFPDYGRYLPRPLDLPNQGFDKSENDKEDIKEDDDPDLLLPVELTYKSGGIFSRVNIANGTKYGPFIGKWEKRPLDQRYAWEVSSTHIFFFSFLLVIFFSYDRMWIWSQRSSTLTKKDHFALIRTKTLVLNV